MADNKRQHFVPKAHFKPFSVGKKGGAIHLYNARADRLIKGASIKGQCAGDYFYGSDLTVEKSFRDIEGTYASIVRSLEQEGVIDEDSLEFLVYFTLLQSLRTEAAISSYKANHENLRMAVFHEWNAGQPPLTHNQAVAGTLRAAGGARQYVADLKRCILVNQTDVEFITSDDPAVLTNRYHFQRLGEISFGWVSSGALVFLPLGPQFALICYDGLVYTLPDRVGRFLNVTRPT